MGGGEIGEGGEAIGGGESGERGLEAGKQVMLLRFGGIGVVVVVLAVGAWRGSRERREGRAWIEVASARREVVVRSCIFVMMIEESSC